MDDFWGVPLFSETSISLSQKKRRQSLFFPLLAPHSRPGESFVGLMRKERKHHQLPWSWPLPNTLTSFLELITFLMNLRQIKQKMLTAQPPWWNSEPSQSQAVQEACPFRRPCKGLFFWSELHAHASNIYMKINTQHNQILSSQWYVHSASKCIPTASIAFM